MRYLILLRGAPGTGKTTWLKENGLTQYAICADDLRLMLQAPQLDIKGDEFISQKGDRKVWSLIYELLEERMIRGELTIVDATHSRVDMFSRYKKLAEQYRYRIYVVTFKDVPLNIIEERNSKRDKYKQVSVDVIRNHYTRIQTQPSPGYVTEISYADFWNHFEELEPIDLSQYKKIHHFGDIHGCYEPLKEYFATNPMRDDEAYIFVGDYIDRGLQNKEVLEFIISIMDKPNVCLLEGNHEKHIYNYANSLEVKSKLFLNKTVPVITDIPKKDLRNFYRKLRQMSYYTFHDKKVIVTHGGLPCFPTAFTSTEQMVLGVGDYEDVRECNESFNQNAPTNCYQVHGHRNITLDNINYGRTYNLNDEVEYGGHFRIVTLDDSGFKEVLIKNDLFDPDFRKHSNVKPLTSDNLVADLRSNKYVQEKQLTETISSFNFTRGAFRDHKWNEQTMTARGLFVNTVTGKIVARSYEKFFNIGERPETDIKVLPNTFNYPVQLYEKYNGFLGITGYDEGADELLICSKSLTQGTYPDMFKTILSATTDLIKLKELLKARNLSLIFEVIDPVNDPHIIEYARPQVVLLDAVYRTLEFKKLAYDELELLGETLKLPVKRKCMTIMNAIEFRTVYNELSTDATSQVEGVVMEDTKGYMVKLKTPYYCLWKHMRGVMQAMAKGRPVKLSQLSTPEENKVFAFMRDLGREELSKTDNIIQIRNKYEGVING